MLAGIARFILGRQPIMLVQMSYSRDSSYGRGRGRSYGGGGNRSSTEDIPLQNQSKSVRNTK